MASTEAREPASAIRRGPVLLIILASYTMIVLDISIVITALTKIHHSLGFSSTALSWVQNAYLLAFGGLLLMGARAEDILGRRRRLICGLARFTLASIAVGTAQSEIWLIAARAVQGVGAAILAPSTLALLQTSFREGPERTRAVAYYAAVAGVAATVGLVIGGMFAGWLSWRVGFFINVPIGIALISRHRATCPRPTAGAASSISPVPPARRSAALLAHRISAALTVGAGLLVAALLIALVVRPRKQVEVEGIEQEDLLIGTTAATGR